VLNKYISGIFQREMALASNILVMPHPGGFFVETIFRVGDYSIGLIEGAY